MGIALGIRITVEQCVKCGTWTEWDNHMSEKPHCVKCWDNINNRPRPSGRKQKKLSDILPKFQ